MKNNKWRWETLPYEENCCGCRRFTTNLSMSTTMNVEELPQTQASTVSWKFTAKMKKKKLASKQREEKKLTNNISKEKKQKKKGKWWENTWNCQNCQISQERRKAAIKHKVKLKP